MTDHVTPHYQEPVTWSALFQGSLAIYSMIFGASVALHALNVFITTTIMPSVVDDIGGLEVYAWTSTVFAIISILSAALASRLLVLAGANLSYVIAAMIFVAGTLTCALSPNIWVLIFGRAVQGLGGGFFYALAYAVIRMVYPSRLWPIAIGLITVMWGVATLTGPAIGGMFAEAGSWRLAFWVLVPFAILVGTAAYFVLPKRDKNRATVEGLPIFQIGLLIAIVLTLSVGSIDVTARKAILSIAVAIALAWGLLRIERQAKARLLPKGGFSLKTPLGVHYACIALLLIGMQPEIFAPYFLQVLHGQSPLWAGYIGALMALGWTAGSVLSASWKGKKASGTLMIGPVLGLIGLLLQAWFLPPPSQGEMRVLGPICIGLIMVGFGIGVCWPHIVTRVYERAPASEQELAAGGVTTIQLFATALGAALGGMVVNLAGINTSVSVHSASNAAFWLCVLFSASPLLGVFAARKALSVQR